MNEVEKIDVPATAAPTTACVPPTAVINANPPATIEWIKNLNTDDEEVIGEDVDD